ncbi:MAG: tRNA epoxyqueuosine(34) reductase QueG [Opitutaceae bacterium]|nr:tRNA epoxyqueuosine(34) reductase QueG [Opitutaceae bacterium]
MDARQQALRQRLETLGFDAVRIARVEPVPGDRLHGWLAAGMHADMAWMERTAAKRLDPALVLPGARSVIMLGVNYATGALRQEGPVWARYALHEDYHDTMQAGLDAAGAVLGELYGAGTDDYRAYVDTGPVLERGWAAKAGLGFAGKNAMLISREHGNWLFLAAILTRVELEPDLPLRPQRSGFADVGLLCGKCTRCLDACPTQAFAAPGVVDARRCISYQTIENKGIIPRGLRRGIGRHLYGCDVCLEVCPWNRFAREGRRLLLTARFDLPDLGLDELLTMTPARFAEVFRRTAIKRLKLRGLLRNACVVAGNSGDPGLLPALWRLTAHELPLVRAHAVWAVRRLAGAAAAGELAAVRARETDAEVLAEFAGEP